MKREVAKSCTWISAHTNPPPNGSKVLALTIGSKLIECVWSKDSIKYCDCWSPYLKIPAEVREIQSNRLLALLKGETE